MKCPILILHGDKDNIVPLKQSKNAIKIIKSDVKELKIIKGAGHGLEKLKHEKQVINLTLNWFRRFLSILQ